MLEDARKKVETILADGKEQYEVLSARYQADYEKWQRLRAEIEKWDKPAGDE
jgi:hypothetical protein